VPYLAKILAMYKDIHGKFKVLVHLVACKTMTNIDGPYGDSRLVATTVWNSTIEAETQTCILSLLKTLLSALWHMNLLNIKSHLFRE
jgi:hypothetical protein